jgi:hypothetical protein
VSGTTHTSSDDGLNPDREGRLSLPWPEKTTPLIRQIPKGTLVSLIDGDLSNAFRGMKLLIVEEKRVKHMVWN